MTRLVNPTTVASTLVALLVWDGVMYLALGTSPVLGLLRGDLASDTPA